MSPNAAGGSIRKFSVSQLWGDPNREYAIPLRTDSPITLIHGLNGTGKTTVLKLLSDFSRRRFLAITAVRFGSVAIAYESGTLQITRSDVTRQTEPIDAPAPADFPRRRLASPRRTRSVPTEPRAYHAVELVFVFRPIDAHNGPEQRWEFLGTDEDWAERIWHGVGPIQRIGHDRFLDESTRRTYSTHELIEVFRDYPGVSDDVCDDIPDWLQRLIDNCDFRLIETQRLQRQWRAKDDDVPRYRRSPEYAITHKAVELCAADMRDRLTKHYSLFAEKSQELDQDFAIRVLDSKADRQAISRNDDLLRLKKAYLTLSTKQQELAAAHIIGNTSMPTFPERELSEDECGVLAIYVRDMDEKLAVFNDMFPKAERFLKTMNELLHGKSLELDAKKDGITVRLHGSPGKQIPLSALSSGEQHLLVLFYDVIFAPDRTTTLLMIDEPEISLHVAWQYKFIELLEKACALSRCQAVVATHSPQIVSGRDYVSLSEAGCGDAESDGEEVLPENEEVV